MKTIVTKVKAAGLGLAVVCAFICLASAKLINANVDFSGNWVLNTAKSDLGQFTAMTPTKMKVKADANGMTADRTRTNETAEMVTNDKFTFDGTATDLPFFGGATRKCTAKWSDDGKTLNITWTATMEYNGQANKLSGSEAWALSDDGKTLTITAVTNFGGNANTTKQVYDKK